VIEGGYCSRGSLGGLRNQGVYASLRAPELEAVERRKVPQLWECWKIRERKYLRCCCVATSSR
jgi:hypothetical protein